ncbi:MAG: hypothetical protein ACYCV1_12450, partial [Acidimicrobiales bacterium]
VHVVLVASPRPLRETLSLVATGRATTLGPLLDPPHVAIDKAAGAVRKDVVRCLASDLVVKI